MVVAIKTKQAATAIKSNQSFIPWKMQAKKRVTPTALLVKNSAF